MEALALLLQIAVPAVLIANVAFRRQRAGGSLAVDVGLAGAYLLAIDLALPSLAAPWYLGRAFAGLLAAATIVAATRSRRGEPPSLSVRSRLWLAFRGTFLVLFIAVAVYAATGRRSFEGTAVDLTFPLAQGTYLVANGGSNRLVNPHLATLTLQRARPYRGQSYAVDLVKVGSWGSRDGRLSPDAPDGFAIFGDTLRAPCSGRVIRRTDGQPDLLDPGEQPLTLEGNHVILDCGGTWIVLAHMRRGSVQVTEGDGVSPGQVLGLVGNSGNSDEPHLHIHAQTPGSAEAPLDGDPIAVTFDNRFLVRNDRVRTR
jgi:hypothetical protein